MMGVTPRVIAGTRFSFGLAALLLAACATRPAANAPVTGQGATIPGAAPPDASYDWHGQMIMPFGTLLKESPVALHEVLLFRDESRPSSESGKDCYTVDGSPPRLVDHEPEEFRLCFSNDRLDRIETSVRLAGGEGAGTLARVCALWLKNSAPAPAAGDRCEGRDGDIAFSAHIGGTEDEAGGGTAGPGSAVTEVEAPSLILILSPAASHESN